MEPLQVLCVRAWLRGYPGRSPLPPLHYPSNLRSALIEQLRIHRNLQHLGPVLSPDLTQLQLTSSAEVRNDLLQRVLQQCSALETLDISGCLGVTDSVISGAAQLSRLSSFLAARTQFGDHSATAFRGVTALTQLDVSRCRLLSASAFAALVASLPSIRRIAALGAPCTSEISLAALPTTITALDWSRSKTTADAFTLLARLPLIDVALHRTLASGTALACLSNIRRLDIGACANVDADSVADLITGSPLLEVYYGPASPNVFRALQGCSQLERLYVTSGRVTDASLQQLAPHVPRLQVINLSRCLEVTDAGIAPYAQWCTNLQTLYFSKVSHLTGPGLGALLSSLPDLRMVELCTLGHVLQPNFVSALLERASTLEYLDFSECANAPPAALERLCGGFPRLVGISLSKTNVDNNSLRQLGLRSTSLTMLNICNTSITLPTLAHLLARLPHLQKFYLSGCFSANGSHGELDPATLPPRLALQSLFLTMAPGCPDSAVAAILERSGNLHTLMLSSNPHLSDAALIPVPRFTPLLQLLDVSDCTGITAVPLRRLRDAQVLHTLSCARVSGVDDALVESLCTHCSILQSLSLQGCTALTPLAVKAIVTRAGPPLETLVMSSGPRLPQGELTTMLRQLTLTHVRITPFP